MPAALVELEMVKRELRRRESPSALDDESLQFLIHSATPVMENLTGPILPVPKTVTLSHGQTVLPDAPVFGVSVTVGGVTVETPTVDKAAGMLTHPCSGTRVVTYTAGRETVPANVQLATVELVSHWWRQRRGGSQTMVPGGESGFVPGNPSTWGVPNRVLDILGPDLRAPHGG